MLIKNLNIEDGLVNGTCGRLERIDLDPKNPQKATCLWFNFFEPDVGVLTREKCKQKFRNQNTAFTPITQTCDQIKYNYNKLNCVITRNQFPLIECEALTIHKSQGQTYTSVAFDLSQKYLNKQLIYVALSRCTSLAGLYLYGQEHLFSKEDFKNWDEKKRLDKAEKEDKKNQITQEMDRLRKHSPMVNIFSILNERTDFNDNCFNIMFHNIATYRRKYEYLNNDFACKNCDVLLFSECHTIPKRDRTLELNDFNMLNISGTNDPNSASGQLCFLNKKSQNVQMNLVNDNSNAGIYANTKDHLELSLFQIRFKNGKHIFICHVYNHPNNPKLIFWHEFSSFLRTHLEVDSNKKITSNLFVIGDFNLKLKQKREKLMEEELGLYFLHDQITTDRGTCIDWCMSNVNKELVDFDFEVYESFYSDHKPLILRLKET